MKVFVVSVADIVFILKDKPHPQFERKENDLIYKPVISLVTVSIKLCTVSSDLENM